MIKLSGIPGLVVTKKVVRNGLIKVSHLFTFDENGNAEIDQDKYSEHDIMKLSNMFKYNENTVITEQLTKLEKIEKAIVEKQKKQIQHIVKKPVLKKQLKKAK